MSNACRFVFAALLATAAAGCVRQSPVRVVRVSPDGLSPQEALEAVRAARAGGDKSAWRIEVAPGHYTLGRPLEFGPEDSGEPGAPVRWVGEYGAVFSGGRRIAGWRDAGDGAGFGRHGCL